MAKISSISVGSIVRDMLLSSEDVTEITENIFPVATDTAELPYIFYRVGNIAHDPTKDMAGADTVSIDITCCADSYAGCVDLAEAVRSALDYRQGADDNFIMRSCIMTGYSQSWADDAHIGSMSFSIKINKKQ